jgi:hypothetical protein
VANAASSTFKGICPQVDDWVKGAYSSISTTLLTTETLQCSVSTNLIVERDRSIANIN